MFRWCALTIVLLLASCNDPIEQPGTWNASKSRSNEANLRVMVTNPHDLVEGTGQDTATGAAAAPPVARVLAGKRYPLPSSNASTIGPSSESQQGPGNPTANQ